MKKRIGLATLGLVAALIAGFLALAALTGGSSEGGPADGGMTDLSLQLDEGAADRVEGLDDVAGAPETPPEANVGDGVGGFAAVGSGGEGEVTLPVPDLQGRKLVRDAHLSLEVADVGQSVQRVESIAVSAGGFVSSSNVFISDPPQPVEGDTVAPPPERTETASVTVRVPASEYTSVMAELRGIADEVRSESSTTTDVTEEFADLEARLRNLEATEQQYLALLDQAETISDILALQDRLNTVRLEIERVQGQINLYNDLTDLATITVQLTPPLPGNDGGTGQGWAEEAWENAWEKSQEVLEGMGTVAIAGAVVLIWLAVPTVVVIAGWRLFGRRARSGEA